MTSQLSVIMLGQRGVGKSTFGNILLGLQNGTPNSFIVNSEDSDRGGKAIGCAHFCGDVICNVDEGAHNPQRVQLQVIDTPGMDAPTGGVYHHMWRDLVHAFDISKDRKISTFILLLKANDGQKGKEMVNKFLDMYGHDGLARCLVVFTYNNNPFLNNAMRHIQIEHFGYLLELLKPGFPFHVWRTDISEEQQRQEIIKMIKEISDHNDYTKDHFTKAQESYTKKVVAQFKAEGILTDVTRDKLQMLGAPDILFGRYLPKSFLSDV